MQQKPMSSPNPQKLNEIRDAVRSLWVIYNTGLTYQTGHEMFRKVIEESMPAFKSALTGLDELTVFFAKGQVRYGMVSLEHGAGLFRKIAETFEAKGVSNLSFTPGLTASELMALIQALASRPEGSTCSGLGRDLGKRGVKHIACRDVRVEVVDKDAVKTAPTTRSQPGGAARRNAPRERSKTWDVDIESVESGAAGGLGDVGVVEVAPGKSFKSFVMGTLDAVKRREASDRQAAELISAEFDRELLEAVEQVKREGEKRVRKLESIKEIVLKQLEELKLAAIVVDTHLNVLAANESGRGILRGVSRIEKGSPLDVLISSRLEEQDVEIDGVKHRAHFIASSTVGGACLITLQ